MSALSPVTNSLYYRQSGSEEKINHEPRSPAKENISVEVAARIPTFKPIEIEQPVIFDMDEI